MLPRTRRFLHLLMLAGVAATALSQSETEPYFALSSTSTFGSKGNASVGMTAWNVDSLEFRVYRIQDPLQFFQQIEDAHMFGGRVARPPREKTLLERIHSWKHGARRDILRSLRGQFTESPSAHFSSVLPHQSRPRTKGTQYAAAPLLNQQQLALTFVQPVRSKSRWASETVDLDIHEKGVYLVEAVHDSLRAYTIAIISDLVMITKNGRERAVNMLVDRYTGQPVADATIALLGRDTQVGEARTNQDGVAEVRTAGRNEPELRLVARHGEDVAVNTFSSGEIPGQAEEWAGYIYTDRPVYRPGHTVHFRGILRLHSASGYQVPVGRKVDVQVQDSDQKSVYQKSLTASANGTIHDEITLPAGAALGPYFIQVKTSGDNFMSGEFEVEEYKKPEYDVRVAPAKTRVVQGENVQAVIDARYYFGEPVSGAKVEYAVYRDRYWFPLWYQPDDESPQADTPPDSDDDTGDQLNQGEGTLDADGKLTINVTTSVSDHKLDYHYRVEARVTDAAGREITGKTGFLATYGSFAVHVEPTQYVVSSGTSAQFKIEARDYDNNPARASVHVELLKYNPRHPDESDLKGTADVDTGSDGSVVATMAIPPEQGTYRVRVSAKTPENRSVEDDNIVWATGGGRGFFDFEPGQTVQMITDKKTYRAGETAKVVVVAGKPGTPVYVTVEGRDLRQCKLLRSEGSTVSFDFPISATDEPGVTVSAAFVRDGDFYTGSKYLKVPPVEHQLNVKIGTDKPQYLPGQTAEYSIEATDASGKPAAGAEFSLGVVDEAIYGIRRDTTLDILGFFFDREWNRVTTNTSLNYYFHGEAGKRRMRLAELRPASRLAQLKPERLVAPKIRKAFPDTAFWAADIVTDGSGRGHAKVEFPDSLTTWRATARGATADTRVGNATLKTIVRKNLILRLAVPRFFVQGDEVVISALVHNYLTDAKTARVSLDADGLDIVEGATRDVQIPSRGEAKIDWRVRAKAVRSATITGKALTDEESDALQLDLPVNVPGVKLSQSRGGSLNNGAEAAFDLTFPGKVEPGSRALSIRVAPSIAGSLFGALEYLTAFPYGCVEQTMSSFLPNITVRQAIRDLGLKANLDDAELQEKIRAGLDRLYSFQHEDGGWGWWQTDESHPFMTAYVVAGLSQARAAGMDIKGDAVDKGVAWVRKAFAADTRLAPDLRAYMMYSLASAGQADAAGLGQVYDRRSALSPYGLAITGLALELAKDARAAEVAATLEHAAHQSDEEAWWPASRDEMLDFSDDVTAEASAYAVKFLSHQRRDNPLLPKAALWLMNHRNEGYWWSSTKQTAMVIYGLTDYLKATNELNPNLTVTVQVNGKQVLSKRLDQAIGIEGADVKLDEAALDPTANHIRITASGQGRLYYAARADYFSNEERLQKTGSTSLNILRDYFRLTPARDGERIVYDTSPLNGPVAQGDILAVRLTVTGDEWKYLLLEDPIPAGTEFIERDDAYALRNRPPWWQFFFDRRELHDDHLAIFQTWFPKGQREYFYLLKVVNPGLFHVSPARVQPMYQTGVMATTESRRLEVK